MFYARHDITDAFSWRAIQALEPVGFGHTAGGYGVAASDHLRFGLGTAFRLVVAGLGLDPSERVERGDKRDIEAVLDAMPSDPRQPVVRVQHVDAALGHDVGFDLVGKLVDDVVELFLCKVIGAGGDVNHTHTGLEVHLCRQIRVPSTNVHMTHSAGMSQVPNEFTNVHVHAAAVSGAGLR